MSRSKEAALIKVADATTQAQAEFLQSLLHEEGVPSTLRRAAGFDVPDLLAAGPRDVLVQASRERAARDVLLQANVEPSQAVAASLDAQLSVLAGVLIGLLVIAMLVSLGTELVA